MRETASLDRPAPGLAAAGISEPKSRSALDLDGRPLHLHWRYDRAELVADAAVHATGLALAGIGAAALVALGSQLEAPKLAGMLIYAFALVAVLGVSAAYNTLPVSPLKWRLRRFDHAAIYLLIAGTYTPFIAHMRGGLTEALLLLGVWAASIGGMVLKLAWPGRFDRLAVLLYLLIGWSGIVAYDTVLAALPLSTLWLLGAGGLLYSAGVAFHLWDSLRFHNAIWHAFVLAAAAAHYAAVVDCLFLARA